MNKKIFYFLVKNLFNKNKIYGKKDSTLNIY